MEITEVKVFPVSEDKLKAFVSIVLDGCFMVNDIKVIRGKDGLFISMPSRKKKNGEFKDVAHPLNNETRQMIEDFVLDEYERILRDRGEVPEVGRRQLAVEDEEGTGGPGAETDAAGSAPRPAAARPAETPAPAADRAALAERAETGKTAETTEEEPVEDKSLEEIQELHLRDSFWSVS